jgi:prephenate dehydrogenase
MKNIGIIGLGLIGGSVAKALKRYDGYSIKAFNRSQASLEAAVSDGVIDEGSTEDLSILSDCDIIFVCTPVKLIPSYVERLLPIIKRDCIITDVGSTKSNIYNEMLKFGDKINYIGGHPMAGSEQTSYKAAKPFLLENAYYVLTPSPTVSEDKISELNELVLLTGAVPIVIKPDKHDYTVAAISHVPHVIAASLVNTVKALDDENRLMHALAAGGFKDITRIASSSPEVWSSICLDNKQSILSVIDSFKAELDRFAQAIKNEDCELSDLFQSARDYRNSFNEKKATSYTTSYELWVDVAERPGIIAQVATALSLNDINIKSIGVINNREYADGILQIVLESKDAKDKCRNLLKEMNYTVYNK